MGFIDNGTGKHQSNTVYNPEAVSPTITTLVNGGTQQIKIVACRGRKSIGGVLLFSVLCVLNMASKSAKIMNLMPYMNNAKICKDLSRETMV